MLHVSKQGIHFALSQLLADEIVVKFGGTPKTIYKLKKVDASVFADFSVINEEAKNYLDIKFLLITEIGKMLEGIKRF